MKRQDFYFDLPEELIAQDPLEDRSSSRLLVLDKKTGATSHHIFREIKDYLKPGDCLVINDTKVIPARLIGEKEGTGGKVEVLLLKRKGNDVWETLVKPGKKMKPGARVSFGDGLLKGEVLEVVEEGNRLIHFEYEGIFEEILDQLHPPAGGQESLPDCVCKAFRICGCSDGRTAFYTGASGRNQSRRCGDCACNASCRTWNFPSGKSG